MIRRVFKAFQYRDFRLMWIGACTSTIGTWMQNVAQAWLIYTLTNSKFLLALDQALIGLPVMLFSVVGGVIADRVDRRYALLGSQYVQMASAFTLTVLVVLNIVKVWEILSLSFLVGCAQSFGGPAYSALIPTLVDKEDMPNAIALNSIQFNVAVTIGPALGGIALHSLGMAWCFGLNGISFLAPIIVLGMLQTRFLPERTSESILSSMRQGFRFIRKQGAMAMLIVLAFLMTFLAVPARTFLPVFARDIFHRESETYAMFLSVSGLGSIVGALAVAGLGNVRNKGRVALFMLVCLGATISGFALSTSLVISYLMLFLFGGSMIAVFAMVISLVQLITTNEMRGRVMSVYNTAFRGGMPVGNLVTGWLVPIFTAPLVLSVAGLMIIALALYFLLIERRVAEL
ncbi:MAG TPA: MFS transporter [Bryobacteraceae bacterium]|nr:MFS transporter [Bryobacteraceae bacterium]